MHMSGRWFKQIVIVVAVLGLLTSAWPSMAQSNETPGQLLEQRLRDPLVYAHRGPAMPDTVSVSPHQPADEDGHDWTKIAVASYRDNNWEIYAAEINSLATRRTVNSAVDFTPDLNRGCTRITFVSTRNGNYEIYVMNFDGSSQTRLTTTSANEYSPRWSPDGSKIAFYSLRDGNAEVYVMNTDGSNQTRLTNNLAWDGHPSWSPDGSKIVFASSRGGNYDLWTMNVDGSNVHQLTFGETDAAYPDWSPDGSQIVFNHDANPPDGFFDIAIVGANGGQVQPWYFQTYAMDYLGPKWHSTGRYIAFSNINWVNINGQWYWNAAYAQARPLDFMGSGTWGGLDAAPYNWWPSWQSTDVLAPASAVDSLASWSPGTFSVRWSGNSDPGTPASGLKSFDVQYRDGALGLWTDWITSTTQTSLQFNGQLGHTYYFRSRARDYAGNLESYPGGNGDTSTTVYQYSLAGQILGNREQPVTVASIAANPAALNTGISRHDGLFDLYFASGGAYTLTTTRNGFGILPPLRNISVPPSTSLPTLFLPPLDDQLSDGHFESGTLSAWNPIGPLTPTITSTAHTGDYAVALGGIVPSDTVDSAPYLSAIEQTITVPLTLTDDTLSLLYQVTAADPLSDTLTAYLIGPTDTLTFTLPVTATDWMHQWFDVSAWTAPTATLRIELATPDKDRAIGVLVDEVTWGSSIVGSRPIYLPVIPR